tara:strand:+ start:5238 stop:5408 length:171 start_codon:yes stop_codon:yes gene_type:complete
MVNIARTLFGFDKKPEPVEEKSDPRLEKKSKFVRPKKKEKKVSERYEPKEVEGDGN